MIILAAIASLGAASAGAARANIAYSAVFNQVGGYCNTTCTYVLYDWTNGATVVQTVSNSQFSSNYCLRYYAFGGGVGCGQFTWNAGLIFQPYDHNYSVWATKPCPSGKFVSQVKSFAPGGSGVDWMMGTLSLNPTCQQQSVADANISRQISDAQARAALTGVVR